MLPIIVITIMPSSNILSRSPRANHAITTTNAGMRLLITEIIVSDITFATSVLMIIALPNCTLLKISPFFGTSLSFVYVSDFRLKFRQTPIIASTIKLLKKDIWNAPSFGILSNNILETMISRGEIMTNARYHRVPDIGLSCFSLFTNS